uniref:Dolichyl-diphosphooligosaccharide--protein glycosyltransferase subunit 1 n=1 Tax=Hippocampus comes TaxID=109280 RepID=A0A3Q2Z6L4_HIPCM
MARRPPLGAFLLLLAAAQSSATLVNDEVRRTVDLSTHLAKITADITLSNFARYDVQSFILTVDPELFPHLAYVGASVSSNGPISHMNAAVAGSCVLPLSCGRHSFMANLSLSLTWSVCFETKLCSE